MAEELAADEVAEVDATDSEVEDDPSPKLTPRLMSGVVTDDEVETAEVATAEVETADADSTMVEVQAEDHAEAEEWRFWKRLSNQLAELVELAEVSTAEVEIEVGTTTAEVVVKAGTETALATAMAMGLAPAVCVRVSVT